MNQGVWGVCRNTDVYQRVRNGILCHEFRHEIVVPKINFVNGAEHYFVDCESQSKLSHTCTACTCMEKIHLLCCTKQGTENSLQRR